jgi:hypothetical protein
LKPRGTWAVQGERRKAKGDTKISAERRSFVFITKRLRGTRVKGFRG